MIDWEDIARGRCYSSSKSLLIDLYYNHDSSLVQLGNILGVSYQSVANKMMELGLPTRERGGPNNCTISMKCPYCGLNSATINLGVKWNDTYTECTRTRSCKNCSRTITTVERQKEDEQSS